MHRALLPAATALALLATTGCGSTVEKSGAVGDKLTAKNISVTVEQVDTKVPVPKRDITGLATPAAGYRLLAVKATVCNGRGAAIGQYDFQLKATDGTPRLKFPAHNYSERLGTVRDSCGSGWIVFEVPTGATPTAVTFGFDNTTPVRQGGQDLHARLTWNL